MKDLIFSYVELNLKVILNVGVALWDRNRLWDVCLMMIVNSAPEVKFMALEVVVQMIDRSIVEPEEKFKLLVRVTDIVKLIPTWKSLGVLSSEPDASWVEKLTRFINATDASPPVTSLCFDILDFTILNNNEGEVNQTESRSDGIDIMNFLSDFEPLRKAACAKITGYLIENPTLSTPEELTRCNGYLNNWTVRIFLETKAQRLID